MTLLELERGEVIPDGQVQPQPYSSLSMHGWKTPGGVQDRGAFPVLPSSLQLSLGAGASLAHVYRIAELQRRAPLRGG